MQCVSARILTISICHGERCPNDPERAKGSKGESNHPEDVSSAMLSQGVLLKIAVLPSLRMRDGSYYEFWVYILTSRTGTLYVGVTIPQENALSQHGRGHILGVLRLALIRFAGLARRSG